MNSSVRVSMGCLPLVAVLLLPVPRVQAQATPDQTLARIRQRAVQTRTDAIRIWQDGQPLLEFDAEGAPYQFTPQSIVKPIAALAILKLIDDGKLTSLDQPVHTLYPEWRQGRKKQITIRHILTHTSGIQNVASVQAELVHLPDRVQAALAAELEEDPGKQWRYNNKAYWLVGGIIERAAGERAEDYIARSLFRPLGMTDARWTYDPSGRNLAVTGGLYLRPDELARIGQLVLDEGVFNGRQLISRELMRQAIAPLVPIGRGINAMGLGWMVGRKTVRVTFGDSAIAALAKANVDPVFRERAAQLRGSYSDWAALEDKVETAVRLVRDHFRAILDSPEFKGKDTSAPDIHQELGRRFMALTRETGFGDFGALVLRIR